MVWLILPFLSTVYAILSVNFSYQVAIYGYVVDINLGTPAQTVTCILDTGSSDLLVVNNTNNSGPYYLDFNLANTEISTTSTNIVLITLRNGSGYDPSLSSTWAPGNLTDGEEVFYQDAYAPVDDIDGKWGTDTLALGDLVLPQTTFGLITQKNATNCILGLGPIYGELSVQFLEQSDMGPLYPSLGTLVAQNTGVEADAHQFSIWVENIDYKTESSTTGTIWFGGYDKYKLRRRFHKVSLVSDLPALKGLDLTTKPLDLSVMLHGVSAWFESTNKTSHTSPKKSQTFEVYNTTNDTVTKEFYLGATSNASISVLLATGQHFSLLPKSYVDPVARSFGMTKLPGFNYYAGSCNLDGYVSLNFSGVDFMIHITELMTPLANLSRKLDYLLNDGSEACVFTLAVAGDTNYAVGNEVLRQMYMAVDLKSLEVGLGAKNVLLNHTLEDARSLDFGDNATVVPAPYYSATSIAHNYTTAFYYTMPTNGDPIPTLLVNSSPRISATWFWLLLMLL